MDNKVNNCFILGDYKENTPIARLGMDGTSHGVGRYVRKFIENFYTHNKPAFSSFLMEGTRTFSAPFVDMLWKSQVLGNVVNVLIVRVMTEDRSTSLQRAEARRAQSSDTNYKPLNELTLKIWNGQIQNVMDAKIPPHFDKIVLLNDTQQQQQEAIEQLASLLLPPAATDTSQYKYLQREDLWRRRVVV